MAGAGRRLRWWRRGARKEGRSERAKGRCLVVCDDGGDGAEGPPIDGIVKAKSQMKGL